MRVLPRENEAVNECWLSDKDRFSYEGLNSEQRLAAADDEAGRQLGGGRVAGRARIRRGELKRIREQHGASAIGALATPHQTLEELYLLQKLVRGLGSGNVDFRLRQADFTADGKMAGAPWLGMTDRGTGQARPRARRRQHAAQGPSAACAPPAPGDQTRACS